MKDAANYLTGIKSAAPSNRSAMTKQHYQATSLSNIVFPLLPWSVP